MQSRAPWPGQNPPPDASDSTASVQNWIVIFSLAQLQPCTPCSSDILHILLSLTESTGVRREISGKRIRIGVALLTNIHSGYHSSTMP
jgi:hypothetical protein